MNYLTCDGCFLSRIIRKKCNVFFSLCCNESKQRSFGMLVGTEGESEGPRMHRHVHGCPYFVSPCAAYALPACQLFPNSSILLSMCSTYVMRIVSVFRNPSVGCALKRRRASSA